MFSMLVTFWKDYILSEIIRRGNYLYRTTTLVDDDVMFMFDDDVS